MAVNPLITAFGETKRASEWMDDKRCKVTHKVSLHQRIFKLGWDVELALKTPSQKRILFDKSKINKGEKIGYLTLTGRYKSIDKNIYLECKCVCGKIYFLRRSNYNKKDVHSCGCKLGESIGNALRTHGFSRSENGRKHPLYSIWCGLKDRCFNKNNPHYHNYGGRGIVIEFKDFFDFYNWAINNGWKKGLTIERKRVNENYSENNCSWITKSKQSRNKRNTIMVTAFGETKSIPDWIEDKRCVRSYSSLYSAITIAKIEPEKAIMNKRCQKQIKAV